MRFGLALIFAVCLWLPCAVKAEALRQDISALPQAEIVGLQRRLTDAGCYTGALDGAASPATKAAMLACPDQRPRLVIETGMHVAPVRGIAVNKACTLAATIADDKTLRLWTLPEARLLRTMRVAVNEGTSGHLAAVAMSSDGRFIVAGGWDAEFEVTQKNALVVFDSETGILVARLKGFESGIQGIAFSGDGRWLAVFLGAGKGLVVIDASNADPKYWLNIAKDDKYGSSNFGGIGFAPNGQLFSVSFEGKLRMYSPGPNFKKIAEIATKSGKQPLTVAVDARSERVAVGFYDAATVDIYDSRTLRYITSTEKVKADKGELYETVWSNDGSRLFATGGNLDNPHYGMLMFDRNGRKLAAVQTSAEDTILQVVPCGDALAIAAADPAFGLVDGHGNATIWRKGIAPVIHNMDKHEFSLSANAKQVRFSLDINSKNPVIFDHARASLTEAPTGISTLVAPIVAGLPIANWDNTTGTTLDGKKLHLEPEEIARSLAIRSDSLGFALGTEWYLRTFNSRGASIGQHQGPAVAWGVNLSADGRIIVAAYGDGTIRWHRWSDGQELLALFVNRDTKAWVAWTPTGFYSASPGGETMIGWHINRGFDQAADFFPADRFRAQFARADIVERILDTLDEAEAVKLANAGRSVKIEAKSLLENLPPVISILSPAEGAVVEGGSITITYIIRSPSGLPVDAVEARIDSRPLPAARGLGPADAMRQCLEETHGLGRKDGALQGCRGSITIDAPQNSAEIGLAARTGARFSEAALVHVTRAATATAASDVIKPKLYALVIGVADYVNPDYRLGLPAKDAKDFAAALEHQKGGLYADVTVQILTDRAATVSAIKRGLNWLRQSTTARDVAILYFAGHGEIEAGSGGFYLLPADADRKELFATALSREDINLVLDKVAGKAIVFLDACHSGAIVAGAQTRGLGAFNVNDVVKDMANADNGIVLFTASTGKQLSMEDASWGNGAFTKALVEGLGLEGVKAKADLLNKGKITLSELDAFVSDRVKELTHGAQSPVMINPKGLANYPLALAR